MYSHTSLIHMETTMSSANSEIQEYWREFIEIYKSFPALWKIKSEEYRNRQLKDDCYKILAKKLKEIEPGADRYAVRKKVNILRSNFRREQKRMRESKTYKPTLWYFDDMLFLSNQNDDFDQSADVEYEESTNSVIASDFYEDILNGDKTGYIGENSALNLLSKACEVTEKSDDEIELQGKIWTSEFRKLNSEQRMFAKKAIDDILFEGRMMGLQRFSVQINGSCNNN